MKKLYFYMTTLKLKIENVKFKDIHNINIVNALNVELRNSIFIREINTHEKLIEFNVVTKYRKETCQLHIENCVFNKSMSLNAFVNRFNFTGNRVYGNDGKLSVQLLGDYVTKSGANDTTDHFGIILRGNQFLELSDDVLNLKNNNSEIDISRNVFSGSSNYAIFVKGNRYRNARGQGSGVANNVNVSSNWFKGYVTLAFSDYYYTTININISRNSFLGDRKNKIAKSASKKNLIQVGYYSNIKNIDLLANQFSGLINLKSVLNSKSQFSSIVDNIFNDIETEVLLDLQSSRNSKVTGNLVSQVLITDTCISLRYDSIINYNSFGKTPLCVLRIDNSDKSDYIINATMNWWHSTDTQEISKKICNKYEDEENIKFQPFLLTKPDMKLQLCSSNCSAKGFCIGDNKCICNKGYQGDNCEKPICDCRNRGICVDVDVCKCFKGWSGENCDTPNCTHACNAKGICVSPDVCTCYGNFKEPDCHACDNGYYLENGVCKKASGCLHCDCVDKECTCHKGWQGDLCDSCADTYSGEHCLPFRQLAGIRPNRGFDLGGTVVTFDVNHLADSANYFCKFGRIVVRGVRTDNGSLQCTSPAQSSNRVTVSMSYNEYNGWTTDKVYFTYYSVCAQSSCGSKASPSRGLCSMGQCICREPWMGENCMDYGVIPIIKPISDQFVVQGDVFKYHFTLLQGTEPVTWKIAGYAFGALLIQDPPSFTWNSSSLLTANSTRITVVAQNAIGKSTVYLKVDVLPSYAVYFDPLTADDLRPLLPTETRLLSGRIQPKYNRTLPTRVDVIIKIKTSKGIRTYTTQNYFKSNVFTKKIDLRKQDVGRIEAQFLHPLELFGYDDSNFRADLTWTVLGIQLSTSPRSLFGRLGDASFNLTIACTGVDDLQDVTLKKVDVPFSISIRTNQGNTCDLKAQDCLLAQRLYAGQTRTFPVNLHVAESVRGRIALTLATKSGLQESRYMNIQLKKLMPELQANTLVIRDSILRNQIYYYTINITNSGLVSANNLRVEMSPNEANLKVVSFAKVVSSSSLITLESGESIQLFLSYKVKEDEQLSSKYGTLVVKSSETQLTIQYKFTVVSSMTSRLEVKVEDEYTYFSAEAPLVPGCQITLSSQLRRAKFTATTNATGYAIFENITEDFYSMYTRADQHSHDSRVIYVSAGDQSVSVFLKRTAVTYTWKVEKEPFEDVYKVKLEAYFETEVPMPVVLVTPMELDLLVLENNLRPLINFKMENLGLITAENVTFTIPSANAHPFIYFEMDDIDLGSIPAKSSIYVAVRVHVDEDKKRRFLNGTRRKRSAARCLGMALAAAYSYFCDKPRGNSISVPVNTAGSRGCSGGGGSASSIGGYYFGSGSGYGSGSVIPIEQGLTCDKVKNCFKAAAKCIPTVTSGVKCVKSVSTIGVPVIGPINTLYRCYKFVKSVMKCRKAYLKCKATKKRRRRRRSILSQDDMLDDMFEQMMKSTDIYQLVDMTVDDEDWYDNSSPEFWREILSVVSEDSENGNLVSANELESLKRNAIPMNMLSKFIERLNSSMADMGDNSGDSTNKIDNEMYNELSDRIDKQNEEDKKAGYESSADKYIQDVVKFNEAKKSSDEGVCAVVKIRIEQRVSLTRDAFRASLDLLNGEQQPLRNISVRVYIRFAHNGSDSKHLFSVGNPEIDGLGDVNGNGYLETKKEGRVSWLFVAYSEAAPTIETYYQIGGKLEYTVNGQHISIDLFPDTITISPDPRLYLDYFLEKFVYSDDAMTPDIVEETVPFTLALLVTNDGFGEARDFKIKSGQPEIIENEKGLLISFSIISARVGLQPSPKSLQVQLGTLPAHSTSQVAWQLTSTLKGTFSNFTATFENINPLGDPQLSVMEKVSIHELAKVVLIPNSDDLPDYLVFSENSIDVKIDRLFRSDNGRNPFEVEQPKAWMQVISKYEIKVYTVIGQIGWTYLRVELTDVDILDVAITACLDNLVAGQPPRAMDHVNNAWLTSHDDVNFVNILFLYSADEAEQVAAIGDEGEDGQGTRSFTVTFGSNNKRKPKFKELYYQVNVSEIVAVGETILTVEATSRDNHSSLSYHLANEDETFPFKLDSMTGNVIVISELDYEKKKVYFFDIIVKDTIEQHFTTADANIQVTVLNENDNKPEITNLLARYVIPSNVPGNHSIVKVNIYDRDNIGTQYQLSTNSTDFVFQGLDLVSGQPSTSIGDHVISLSVSDGDLSSDYVIVIGVLQQNVNPPRFNLSIYNVEIDEGNYANETLIGEFKAMDDDLPRQTLSYRLIYDPTTLDASTTLDGEAKFTFRLSELTGELFLSGDLDRETLRPSLEGVIALTIAVSDDGAPVLRNTCAVNIQVRDLNDNPPRIALTSQTPTYMVPEAQAFDYLVATLPLGDDDVTVAQHHHVTSHQVDNALFNLYYNVSANVLYLITTAELDYDSGITFYLLTIKIADKFGMTSQQQIRIEVLPVNDNAPIFLWNQYDPYKRLDLVIRRSEITLRQEMYTLQSSDKDNDELFYSLEDEHDLVAINPKSGAILFKDYPRNNISELRLKAFVSDNLHDKGQLNIGLHLSDRVQNGLDVEGCHGLVMKGSQDNGCTFEVQVKENSPTNLEIFKVNVIDYDNENLNFEIQTKVYQSLLKMNTSSGIIYLSGILNYEEFTNIFSKITVTDKKTGNNSIFNIIINVVDVNEFSPIFVNGDQFAVAIPEGVYFENFYVAKVSAEDGDIHQKVTYEILNGTEYFTVDQKGVISTRYGADFSVDRSPIVIVLKASDDAKDMKSSSAVVHIRVIKLGQSTTPTIDDKNTISRTTNANSANNSAYLSICILTMCTLLVAMLKSI